jgi:hypothetical protein
MQRLLALLILLPVASLGRDSANGQFIDTLAIWKHLGGPIGEEQVSHTADLHIAWAGDDVYMPPDKEQARRIFQLTPHLQDDATLEFWQARIRNPDRVYDFLSRNLDEMLGVEERLWRCHERWQVGSRSHGICLDDKEWKCMDDPSYCTEVADCLDPNDICIRTIPACKFEFGVHPHC